MPPVTPDPAAVLELSNQSLVKLRAAWVFPGDGEPLENGVVEIERGRIVAVHNRAEPSAYDLGAVALIPGLVNAHTHLEFSDVSSPLVPALPFTAWIRNVVAWRRGRSEPVEDIVQRGLAESRAAGGAVLGEIATDDGVAGVIARSNGPGAVVFRELLGLLPEQVEPQLAIARAHLAAGPGRGLSPHAPYSVNPELFQRLIDLAVERRAPVAMHLAETRAELELLADGTGEFVEMLRTFGVWRDGLIPRGSRPRDYLERLAEAEQALVVHGNYLDRDELEFVVRNPQLTVVYCPRTHAFFGHEPHPWRELIERGASVAIGTDSRASNPDLNLWSELRFLRSRFPGVAPRVLLELGTIRGARALGLADELGTLTPGKRAQVAAVPLPQGVSDPWLGLFVADAASGGF